jgi:hypothetical protein
VKLFDFLQWIGIEPPHVWAAREGARLGAQMNAAEPCVCNHGRPFHKNDRRSQEMIDRSKLADGQCSGLGCKCVSYERKEASE